MDVKMKKLFVVQKLVEEMNEKAWSDTKLFASEEKARVQFLEWKKEIQDNYLFGFECVENEDEFSYELEIYAESNYSVIIFEQEIEDQ